MDCTGVELGPGDSRESRIGVSSEPGVGDGISTWDTKGPLCGNGDMSIISAQPGDDEGSGGVVT
jgi:hypothetical protein